MPPMSVRSKMRNMASIWIRPGFKRLLRLTLDVERRMGDGEHCAESNKIEDMHLAELTGLNCSDC